MCEPTCAPVRNCLKAHLKDPTNNPVPEDCIGCLCGQKLEEKLDPDEPTVFVHDDMPKLLGMDNTSVADKVKLMTESMVSHPKWYGCMGDIPDGMQSLPEESAWGELFGTDAQDARLGGGEACPWITSMRPNTARFGASAVPQAGVASLMHSLNAVVYLHFFPVKQVLDKSIDPESFASWQDTSGCEKFREEETWLLRVAPGDRSMQFFTDHVFRCSRQPKDTAAGRRMHLVD